MIRLPSCLLFVSLLLLPPGTRAQRGATIAGNVYYGSDYNPAQNIVVSLYEGEQHVFIESETTSDGGQFRFSRLSPSVYSIGIDIAGYQPVSLNVDVSFSSDRSLAIYLKPIAPKQDSPHSQTVSVHELSMPVKAREFMDSGLKKLYRHKDAQAALVDFQQAVSVAPTYYEAVCQLAMAQLTLGNQAEAEFSFRKAIELSGDNYAEAHVGLGAVLLDRGDISEADKSIRQGLHLNPNLWLGHYELGRALLKQNRLFEAQTSAEHARLLAPSAPIVYRLLSNIHLKEEDFPSLLADLDKYVSLDPDSPAGVRAKQLRDQVQVQVETQHLAPASTNP